MRRLRPCLVNTGWGGAGAPPGAKAPARSWLTDEARKASTKSAARRRKKNAAMARRKARRSARIAHIRLVAPDGAPSPRTLSEGRGKRAHPAPTQKQGRRSVGLPCVSSPRKRGPIFRRLSIGVWLWIPAFAGMTKKRSVGRLKIESEKQGARSFYFVVVPASVMTPRSRKP